MSYDMEFHGKFAIQPPLRPEHVAYLGAFNRTRRVKRDPELTALRGDPIRTAAGLSIGEEGGYFVGETGAFGEDRGADVLDANRPPVGQPELWCHWAPTPDGSAIVWDGQEKFYEYERWIAYLIGHFLAPWGYLINGKVECLGEDWCEPSALRVEDNHVFFWGAEV